MRYQTVERCTDAGCRCEDRAGVVLYDGDSREAAEAAREQARYDSVDVVAIADDLNMNFQSLYQRLLRSPTILRENAESNVTGHHGLRTGHWMRDGGAWDRWHQWAAARGFKPQY